MKCRERGQVLIILIVFLPVLLLIFELLGRSTKTMLVHDQVENHCDRKVLDALAIEAQGLQRLGELNYFAKLIIQARRVVDGMIAAAAFYIIAEPALVSMQRALTQGQRAIEKVQKTIKITTSAEYSRELKARPPTQFRGKITETYNPLLLSNFYLKADAGFEGEIGAPLEPDSEFKDKAVMSGKIRIITKRILELWPNVKPSPDMFLECKGQIKMERLEEKWSVQLINPVDKPSSSSQLL